MTRADTGYREDIIRMACEVGLMGNPLAFADWYLEALERFAERVRADEREACAKVCDEVRHGNYYAETDDWISGTEACAEAIRARGNT